MSNDIVSQNPHLARIQAVTQVENVSSGISFPTSKAEGSRLSETYFIAHYDGEGASTLALLLSEFISPEPMIMEIGTPASRAFKSLTSERRFTPEMNMQYPARTAMDERLRHPEIPTIAEFGRMHWRDAIDTATKLQNPPFAGTVYFCFLASENDRTLQIPNLAVDSGLQNVIVFGGYKLARETRERVIKIPTIPIDMQRLIFSEGLSLTDAANASDDRFSALEFLVELKKFGSDVEWEMSV